MAEDMTYTAEPTRAQLVHALAQADSNMVALAQRNAELAARVAELEPSGFAMANSALIQRVQQLERENAELRARLDAVPVEKLTLADGAIAIKLTPEQSERLRPLVAQVWGVPCDEFGPHYGLVLGQAQGFSGKNGDLTVATFRFVDHAITCEIEDIVRRYGVGVQCTQVADDTDAPLTLAPLDEDGDE